MKEESNTSDILESVVSKPGVDSISLSEIKSALHEKGFAILMLIFALPLSIPLPVPPGYTTVLSLPLLFFSIQVLFGYDTPWLPEFIGRKSIKRRTLAFFIEKTVPLLRKVERFSKHRFPIFNNSIGERVYGLISFICAVSISIPLPMTNFIPAGGIALMSLGLLNRDGIMAISGIIVSFIGLAITAFILVLGQVVVMKFFSFLAGFFW